MNDFFTLKKNLKISTVGFNKHKLALLGDNATQFFKIALKGKAAELKLDLEVWESDFNQIDIQILNPISELYSFKPQSVLLCFSVQHLQSLFYATPDHNRINFASNQICRITELVKMLSSNGISNIMVTNYAETDDGIWGEYSNKLPNAFLFQTRKLNGLLADYASQNETLNLINVLSIQSILGDNHFFHNALYINSDVSFSLNATAYIATKVLNIILCQLGKFKKCIILDLDNTLWGGVIGDDGIEHIQIGNLGIGKAFYNFQCWLKELKKRGIILAVCSKNNMDQAQLPFLEHPDMVLKLEDIAVFVANWENKAINIQHIQTVLNIGYDSMVFVDDNPFEREMVKQNISGISVPDLPEDPALYISTLKSYSYFETLTFSSEDIARTKLYQTEAKRVSYQKSFVNENDFLIELQMTGKIDSINSFNIPRVAQLSQRSNQFNLRTVRYTENDLTEISKHNTFKTFAFNLSDKFGNHGLIAVVILKEINVNTYFIDTWFMSCRVLKRTTEQWILNSLVDCCKQNAIHKLHAEYIPSPKNSIVKDLYLNLGFTPVNGIWELNIHHTTPLVTYINI